MQRARRAVKAARRTAAAAGLLLAGGSVMGACSNGGTSLAQEACVHIDTSIRLFTRAEHESSQSVAARDAKKAIVQLEQAEQLAAQANSADPAYNPLMTTLQEIGRTSEANLIPALQAQCDAANNPTAQGPVTSGPAPVTAPGRASTGA